MTTIDDVNDAISLGVDALGFIFYDKSPRCVSVEQVQAIIHRLPPFVTLVGVFVNAPVDYVNHVVRACSLDRVQLHGDESPDYCMALDARVIKAFRVATLEDIAPMSRYQGIVAGVLLDTKAEQAYGGTGAVFDWGIALSAKDYDVPLILSGGINNDNIKKAVDLVGPSAIDLCSGIESAPGKKDYNKMKQFMAQLREL